MRRFNRWLLTDLATHRAAYILCVFLIAASMFVAYLREPRAARARISGKLTALTASSVRIYWDDPSVQPQSFTSIALHPAAPDLWNVRVDYLAEKNPASHGSEVWLVDVYTPDEHVDWKKVQMNGPAWEFREDGHGPGGKAALAYGNDLKSLTATLHGKTLTTRFLQHDWSGKVRVTVNDRQQEFDLYSAKHAWKINTWDQAENRSGRLTMFTGELGTPQGAWKWLTFVPQPEDASFQVHSIEMAGRPCEQITERVFVQNFTADLSGWQAPAAGGFGAALICIVVAVMLRRRLSNVAKRLILAVLGGGLLLPVVSNVLFAEPGGSISWLQRVLAYVYSAGVLWILISLRSRAQRTWDAPANREVASLWSVPAPRAFIVVLAAAAATMMVFVFEDQFNSQHAIWTKLTVETGSPQPPAVSLRYGPGAEDQAVIQWQPYQDTIISCKRASPGKPFQVGGITADGQAVALESVKIQGGHRAGSEFVIDDSGGELRWPGGARNIELRVVGDAGTITLFWLDQSSAVVLDDHPKAVRFRLPGTFQGWALLPPNEIFGLEFGGSANAAFRLKGVEILANPEQRAEPAGGDLKTQPGGGRIQWPSMRPVNETRPVRLAAIWLGLFAVLALAGISVQKLGETVAVTTIVRRLSDAAPRDRKLPWEEPSRFLATAVVAWGLCLGFHLVYALSVRTSFTNDSRNYYTMAQHLLMHPSLSQIEVGRTPGYPSFIAAVIAVFGDTAIWISVLQQLALASLSLVTLWCFWERLPRPAVFVAAVLTGLCPAIAVTGNVLWSEALYTVCLFSGLLFASCVDRGQEHVFAAGLLIGAATMVRPNGLIALAAVVGTAILVLIWNAARRFPIGVFCRNIVLLCGGYCVIAAPWHLHLVMNRHTLALGKGYREFGVWAGYIFQNRMPEDLIINRPNRSLYGYPAAYRHDPYTAISEFPFFLGGDSRIYFREAREEWQSSFANTLPVFLDNIGYDILLKQPEHVLPRIFPEISTVVELARLPSDGKPRPDMEPTERLLWELTAAPYSARSPARSLCLRLSSFILRNWLWLVACAALGALLVLVSEPALLPVLITVGGSIWAFAGALVPSERYIVVFEPLYYLLTVCAITYMWRLLGATVASRSLNSAGVGMARAQNEAVGSK